MMRIILTDACEVLGKMRRRGALLDVPDDVGVRLIEEGVAVERTPMEPEETKEGET